MIKLGVMGCGFVGSALVEGFKLHADIKIFDKFKTGFDQLDDVADCDIIFFCVPTPMKTDGSQNISFMEQAISDIATRTTGKVLVIKSTVLPGTTRRLQQQFPGNDLVSNPEFLTARCGRLDFINASRIILGSTSVSALDKMEELYRLRFLHTPIYRCLPEEAEFVKYMANCYFAAKVSYLNEIYLICKKLGLDFELLKKMWLSDGRIGNSHTDVPGHDGDFGYGGTCFPKDMSAFICWARALGMPIKTLEAAEDVNWVVRKNHDWEISDLQAIATKPETS